MANKFQKGDVVVLKSGGPPMTIDSVPGDVLFLNDKRRDYHTRWFKGASKDGGDFAEHLLEAYVPPKKK
jgi:uncharacterized protein YodC (DUF2158 family)